VHGPNGFYREFKGAADDARVEVSFRTGASAGSGANDAILQLVNQDQRSLAVVVDDLSYGAAPQRLSLAPAGAAGATASLTRSLAQSFGWYDLRIRIEGSPAFEKRYAGRVETGSESFSDPRLGSTASPGAEA
jgi:phospholipase C